MKIKIKMFDVDVELVVVEYHGQFYWESARAELGGQEFSLKNARPVCWASLERLLQAAEEEDYHLAAAVRDWGARNGAPAAVAAINKVAEDMRIARIDAAYLPSREGTLRSRAADKDAAQDWP